LAIGDETTMDSIADNEGFNVKQNRWARLAQLPSQHPDIARGGISGVPYFVGGAQGVAPKHLRPNCVQAAVRGAVGAACPSGRPGSRVHHSRAHQETRIAHLSLCALVLHRVRDREKEIVLPAKNFLAL
jgi:hypothetical protein